MVLCCWHDQGRDLVQMNHQPGDLHVLLNPCQSALVSPSLEWLAYSRTTATQSYHNSLADNNKKKTTKKTNKFLRLAHLWLVQIWTFVSMNEVKVCRAWSVLGWVTVSRFNSRSGASFISVSNQPHRSTQPGHLFVGRHNE